MADPTIPTDVFNLGALKDLFQNLKKDPDLKAASDAAKDVKDLHSKKAYDVKDMAARAISSQIAKFMVKAVPAKALQGFSKYEMYAFSGLMMLVVYVIRIYTNLGPLGDDFVTNLGFEVVERAYEKYQELQTGVPHAADPHTASAPGSFSDILRNKQKKAAREKLMKALLNDKRAKNKAAEFMQAFNDLFKDKSESEKSQIMDWFEAMTYEDLITFFSLDPAVRAEFASHMIEKKDKAPDIPVTDEDHFKKLKEHLKAAKEKFIKAMEKTDEYFADGRIGAVLINRLFNLK